MIIEQQRNGAWYRFLPREAFLLDNNHEFLLSSKHLILNFNHWQSLTDPSLVEIVNPQTNATEYLAHLDLKEKEVTLITRVRDGAVLSYPSAIFSHFESSEYTHEWYSQSILKQVELPRYGLNFNYDPKEKKLFCEKMPGFYLSEKQHVPFLGTFDHYLVLENAKGEKKVLLPEHHFKPPAKDFESLEPKYRLEQNLSPERPFKQNFMIFDVHPNGTLKASAKKANLFLSYILLGAGKYESAANYLRKYGPKLSAYNQEEKELILRIITLDEVNGDKDGNAIVLRLYANYLLLKNHVDHNQPIAQKFKQLLSLQLNEYLEKYHHVTAFKLSAYEESFLLKFALNEIYDTKQFIRLNELDPAYAKAYLPPKRESSSDRQKPAVYSLKKLLSQEETPQKTDKPFSSKKALITRIDAYLHTNFVDIYKMAIQGSPEEKKWLDDALTFAQYPKGLAWRALIACILKNPTKFPPYPLTFPAQQEAAVKKAWWDMVLQTADELGKAPSSQQKKPPTAVPNLTPAEFRLDPKPVNVPPIDLAYKIPAFKPFKRLCRSCFKLKKALAEDTSALKSFFAHEAEHPVCSEPIYKKKFEQWNLKMAEPNQQQVSKRYEFNKNATKKLEKVLNAGKTKAESRLKNLHVEILELANRRSSQGADNVLQQLQGEARQLKLLTLDDLLVCFAKKDSTTLLRRNPGLDEKNIRVLFGHLGEFLALQTHEHQRQRATLLLQEVRGCQNASEKEELIQQLATTLLDKRRYQPNENPAYLVFEYYANIYLRSPQVDMLARFLKEGDLNPIVEMIMGSGKSKVLLPLLALLRADGESLSMIVVPQPLFESVSSDTQKILDDAFALPLRSLHFDRNTAFSIQSLRTILDDLNMIQKERESLIVTSKSIECFILKFVEKCSVHLPRGEFPEELQLMQQILLKLEKAFPFIDEADSILNVLHEVCFSLGNKRALIPSEVQTLSLLFNLLYTDPEIKALAQLDSDPKANAEAPVFTEELYHQEIKHKLANKFLAALGNEIFESPLVASNVQHFMKGLDTHNKNTAISYLCHETTHLKEAQAFFNQQHDDVKNILALAAEEISSFLPHTLVKGFNKKYGLDTQNQGQIAIPYTAANTPSTGSQFANSYITMNYTFQTYMKAGVTKETILKEIVRLQSTAMNELKENPGLTLEKTEAWQIFCKLKGSLAVPLFNQKEIHIEQIVNLINSCEKQKNAFVSNIILPQLEIFSQKTGCNPHILIAFFKKRIIGCTGTLWNSESMHKKLAPEPEPGTEIKTIKILQKHSLNEVYVIKESSTEMMLEQLNSQQISYDLISDAGGYFKEGGNMAIARTMAAKNGKPVVFYNRKNEQTETDGVNEILLSESKTPLDKRQTFLDQSHTTGADVHQKIGAIGLVTIDGNMLLRDLLQAVWRLRGLETKGQRIKFVLTQEVQSIIQQKLHITHQPTFNDILRFTVMNQVLQQGKDNFKALRQELDSIIQFLLLDLLVSDKFSKAEKEKAFLLLQNEWIKEGNLNPKDLYGTICHEEDSAAVLQDLKVKFLHKVDGIFATLPFLATKGIFKAKTSEEMNQICKKYENSLPAKVLVPLRDTDSDQTVETEQETEQETEMQTETELEVQKQQQTEPVELGLHNGFSFEVQKIDQLKFEKDPKEIFPKTPCLSLKDYFEHNSALKGYANAFNGIYSTLNVFEWPAKNPCPADLKLFGNHRTPFHFVKVQDNTDVVVLSQAEAGFLKEKAYNLAFGFYDESKPVSDELLEKIVKVEFLNGESSYSKKKQEILKKWFQEQGPEKMRTLFQQHILAGYPEKTAAYSNSHLQNIFKEAGTAT